MNKSSTRCAGVDISKRRLDVSLHGAQDELQVSNDKPGHEELIAWLRTHGITRVGMEATGGYERTLLAALAQAGFQTVLHQPLEVRLFARLRRQRAKNDRLDARLIAAATAQLDAVKAAADPRMADLAERLTAYDQACDLAAQLKVSLEHLTLDDLIASVRAQLARMLAHKACLARDLIARIKQEPDLAGAFALLTSLPGVGSIVAMGLIIRMPELGSMEHGQAASLLGVAPFDRDSGNHKGVRTITGGRPRARRLLYLAALSARRCDPGFRAFAKRLADAGKKPKVIIVAIMRKLIEAANCILKRKTPWVTQCPQTT